MILLLLLVNLSALAGYTSQAGLALVCLLSSSLQAAASKADATVQASDSE